MTDVHNSTDQFGIQPEVSGEESRGVRPATGERKRLFSLGLVLASLACFLITVAVDGRVAAVTAEGPSLTAGARANTALVPQDRDFSKFSHTTREHVSKSCASCHRRAENNSPTPGFPGHKACTDCHLQQFVTNNVPMCVICHTNLDSRNPPLKNFPDLRSFNAKFDHAQHDTGSARPENGCVACHTPARRGIAQTIPANLPAHTQCYQCHTPRSQSNGRDIASCGVCHDLASYSPTGSNARAYRVGFSHADHSSRQGMNCADCHSLRGGLPQAQQVSSTRPTQHFGSGRGQSCMTCHNNVRTFGGNDFGDCKRCHTGQTFRLGL